MDLPDEELQQPLVAPPQQRSTSPVRSPQHAVSASPKRGGNKPKDLMQAPGLANPMQPTTTNYVAMRNVPANGGEDEEKGGPHNHAMRAKQQQQQLPYAAPNVHPYAVPQYQPHGGYGNESDSSLRNDGGHDGGSGWGTSPDAPFDDARDSTIDIAVSGMYTLAAALTVIQGFRMLLVFTYSAIALGFYTMAFGAAVVLYDLKSVVYGVSVEAYFPFLGNYIGRALTILYFAVLCAQAHAYGGWTRVIVLYNLVVAALQGVVYVTTKTVTSPMQPPHMEDMPDI